MGSTMLRPRSAARRPSVSRLLRKFEEALRACPDPARPRRIPSDSSRATLRVPAARQLSTARRRAREDRSRRTSLSWGQRGGVGVLPAAQQLERVRDMVGQDWKYGSGRTRNGEPAWNGHGYVARSGIMGRPAGEPRPWTDDEERLVVIMPPDHSEHPEAEVAVDNLLTKPNCSGARREAAPARSSARPRIAHDGALATTAIRQHRGVKDGVKARSSASSLVLAGAVTEEARHSSLVRIRSGSMSPREDTLHRRLFRRPAQRGEHSVSRHHSLPDAPALPRH